MCLLLPLEDLDEKQLAALKQLGEFADYPGEGQAEQWDQVRTAMLKYRLGDFTDSYRLSEQPCGRWGQPLLPEEGQIHRKQVDAES